MEDQDLKPHARAFKANRLSAGIFALATAMTLLMLRPELSLAYAAFLTIAVCLAAWAGTRGVFGQPRAVIDQNFMAYVSMASLVFFGLVYLAPFRASVIGFDLMRAGLWALNVLLTCAVYRAVIRVFSDQDRG